MSKENKLIGNLSVEEKLDMIDKIEQENHMNKEDILALKKLSEDIDENVRGRVSEVF